MTDSKQITRLAGRFRPSDSPSLLFLLAALFWSGNFVLARLMHTEIPPVALAFWRWAGAAIIVTGLAWPHLKRDRAEIRRKWPVVLLLSLLGIAAMNTLLYAGLQWTTVVNASLLMALMPALIMLYSFLFLREGIRLSYAVGILLSLSGACIVILQGNPLSLSGLVLNRGDLLVFLAAAFFAAYSVAMRYRPAVHSLSLMSITFSVGALCLLPVWVWEVAAGHTMTISLPTLLTIGYLMLFPSVIAYFCFNRCIELIGSVRAGFSIQLVPVFSSLLGVLLLGEPFARYHAWGTVLIAAGILLTMPLTGVCQRLPVLVSSWRKTTGDIRLAASSSAISGGDLPSQSGARART